MNSDQLRALQAPLKARYKDDPTAALTPVSARGVLGPGIACRVESRACSAPAGLHPATGGDGTFACSGDMLLESLVACAGVTLLAVATALGIEVRGGAVVAEGTFDARGTLGVSKEAPVGLTSIQLRFELDTDAPSEKVAKLLELTERYCVVYQTLRSPPEVRVERPNRQ
jgi:uncharacterized OsmC-like protein